MQFFTIAAAVLWVDTSVSAVSRPQADESARLLRIAYIYENGTSSDLFSVPDQISDVLLVKISGWGRRSQFIEMQTPSTRCFVFMSTPGGTRVPGRCTFLEPDRQALGSFELIGAGTRQVDPPAMIGFVQCNTVGAV